jgi:tetratricopeptide (TPR) repeat protein
MSNDSSASKCYFDVGEEEYKQGKYEEAERILQVAKSFAENDFERAMALNKIAWCWRYLGFKEIKDTKECYKKAESCWRECLELLYSLSDRSSKEIKVSTIKGLMLIFSKEQAEILYWACIRGLKRPENSDLILDLDNSLAIMLKASHPEEAGKIFERIYADAKALGNYVLAGHAAQHLGTISMQRYGQGFCLDPEGPDLPYILEDAEIWLIKSLLIYPEGEVAHIQNTVKKLHDIFEKSRINGTSQFSILYMEVLEEGNLDCPYDELSLDKSYYGTNNVPTEICEIAIMTCCQCGRKELCALFEEEV